MKKVSLFLFCIFVSLSFVASVSSYEYIDIQKGNKLDEKILNEEILSKVNLVLKKIYEKENVIIKIQVISEKVSGVKELSDVNRYVQEEFTRQNLNLIGTPSFNLLLVLWTTESGDPYFFVGFSDMCGWDQEKLALEVSKSEDEYWEGRNIFENIVGFLKSELDSANSFKVVCEAPELPSSCEKLFPYSFNSKNKFKRIAIVLSGYTATSQSIGTEYDKNLEFSSLLSSVEKNILGLRKNSVWDKYFEEFEFVYYVEPELLNSDIDENILSKKNAEIESLCQADNVVFFINDNFRSYANFGDKIVLSAEEIAYKRLEPEIHNAYFFGIGDVLIHELGHSIFCLRDEYVEGFERKSRVSGLDFPGVPNCAESLEEAKSWWGDLIGFGEGNLEVGFYGGCSYVEDNIKAHKNSVMNGDFFEFDYGLVSDRYIDKIISGEVIC